MKPTLRPGEGEEAETLPSGRPSTEADTAELSAPLRPAPIAPAGTPGRLPVVPREVYAVGPEIARGGMGRIVSAEDRRLGRPVAIKEVLPGGPEAAARFEREALTTARLQHPAIVNVYEAGRWPDGAPFYAMKLVSGRPLDTLVASMAGFDQRLALLPNVIAVVEALAYAHAAGVIHRDLKPANVLVGSFGETVVIDWGLAKSIGSAETVAVCDGATRPAALADDAQLTAAGVVIGTPSYMAPEQARGAEVDARTDVYALGAILYHVLAGERPFQGASSLDVLRRVLAGPPPPIEQRVPTVPSDLAAIVHKAMAPAAADRYPTASELAADLKRFQTGQLVSAHRYSRADRVRRFVRRHRAVIAVVSAASLLLTVMAVASVQRIRRERSQAVTARAEAEAQRNALLLSGARSLASRDPGAALALLRQYPQGADGWPALRAIASEARTAGLPQTIHRLFEEDIGGVDALPDGRLAAVTWSGRTLALLDPRSGGVHLHESPARTCRSSGFAHVAASLDGTHLVTTGCDAQLVLWDTRDGTSRVLGIGDLRWPVSGLAWYRDGRRLLVSGHGAAMVDTTSGEARIFERAAFSDVPTVSPDMRWGVLPVSDDSDHWSCRLLDFARGSARTFLSCWRAVFSDDGTRLAVGHLDGTVELVSLPGGASRTLTGHDGVVGALAFTSDRRGLVTGADNGTLRIWDLPTGTSRVVRGHQAALQNLSLSPDGVTIASTDLDGEVRLTKTTTGEGRIVRHGLGRGAALPQVAFTPDGATLAVAGSGGHLVLFPVPAADGRTLCERGPVAIAGQLDALAFSLDGLSLATADRSGVVRLWSIDGHGPRLLGRHRSRVRAVRFLFGGRLASAGDDGVRLWDPQDGSSTVLSPTSASLDASADGRWLALAGEHGVDVLEVGGGGRFTIGSPGGGLVEVRIAADAARVLGRLRDGTLRLWTVAIGASVVLRRESRTLHVFDLAPDGRRVAAASSRQPEVWLWPAAGGEPRVLRGAERDVSAVAFSPDGRSLAAADREGGVRLLDVESGRARLLAGGRDVSDLAWSADGTTLAGLGGRLQLWDVASGERRDVGPASGQVSLAVSQREPLFAVGSWDGVVTLWRDDLPRDARALRAWMDTVARPVAPAR